MCICIYSLLTVKKKKFQRQVTCFGSFHSFAHITPLSTPHKAMREKRE